MLRNLLFAAALMAAPGGMGYASAQTSHEPQAKPHQVPGDSAAVPDSTPSEPDGAPASPGAPQGVAGIYLCEGTNPDGSPYHGLVQIAAIDNTYLVHWVLANGTEVLGVGILRSDLLSVSYFGGTPAVAVYRVDGDRLLGEWTMGGAEGMVYSETLTRMAEPPAGQAPQEPREPQAPRERREPEKEGPRQAQPIRGVLAV